MSTGTRENEGRVDYIEFPATDIEATQRFYSGLFGWKFTDYGPDYTSFEDGRMNGGFFKADAAGAGQPLVVLYSADLEGTESRVRAAGGRIVKEIFSFPGGRRFHFRDPNGNELSVWSDK
jgi:predicted enzyme related to lactoylglutathione lyase